MHTASELVVGDRELLFGLVGEQLGPVDRVVHEAEVRVVPNDHVALRDLCIAQHEYSTERFTQ